MLFLVFLQRALKTLKHYFCHSPRDVAAASNTKESKINKITLQLQKQI